MGGEAVNPMVELLKSIALIANAIFAHVGTIASTITSTPLLLLTVGFLVVGGAIGIFGRLLSRN
ncbi:hypothetical protein [Solobacterium moorei]